MSILTKVMVLLVSVMVLFLCGVVTVFVANTHDYKSAWESEKTKSHAAQVTAVVAEEALKRGLARRDALVQILNSNILALELENARLLRDWETTRQEKSLSDSTSATAIQTMQSLRETIQDMYTGQTAIQKGLDEAFGKMTAARVQVVDLRRELNRERVRADSLDSLSRQRLEKIYEIENENSQIRARLEQVKVASSKWVPDGDVGQVAVGLSGVPIRGQITEVREGLASISVGSAAGVRKGMKFLVYRDAQYMGDLQISHVESSESAGLVVLERGSIVRGDSVTTGFN